MITTSIKNFQDLEDMKLWLMTRNNEYRIGNPTITDLEYDEVWNKYKELTSEQITDGEVKYLKVDNKRIQCPIPLAGLTKLTTPCEFLDWIKKNNLYGKLLTITPKYDGISCGLDNTDKVNERGEKNVYVKGEDNMAFSISHHFTHVRQGIKETDGFYHIGEIIIPTRTFNSRYSSQYKNVRNFVAGKMNPNSQSTPELADFVFMRYNLENVENKKWNKSQCINYLNIFNEIKVPYYWYTVTEETTEKEIEKIIERLYLEWKAAFEIDGIVIDVDNYDLRKSLGRDTVGNPKYSVALKFDFISEKAIVKIQQIKWTIDKDGVLNPSVQTDIANIDGASIGNNIFIDNIKYMKENGIYEGKTIEIKRGGKIIPRISKSIVAENDIRSYSSYKDMVEKGILPYYCPYCAEKLNYDENSVSVSCPNECCSGRSFRRVLFFFETIKAKGISSATLEKMLNNMDIDYYFQDFDYDKIAYIIHAGIEDDIYSEFGELQKKNIREAIETSLAKCPIERLMSATNAFPSLGETKLKWIVDYFGLTYDNFHLKSKEITLEKVMLISGYSEITANIFLNGLQDCVRFISFIYNELENLKEIYKTTKTSITKCETNIDLSSENFCFTGFRNPEAEELIKEYRGTVKNSLTNSTTILVVKEKGLGTVKEKKAQEKGIKIINEIELREMLGMKTIIQELQDQQTDQQKALW